MRTPTEVGEARCPDCVELGKRFREQREILIEVLGRDGKGGTLWKTLNDHVEAYAKRGARLGEMEKTLATLRDMRTQLRLIGGMAAVGLVAFAKAVVDWLFQ